MPTSLINRPDWKVRRSIIILALLFCAFNITYTNIWGDGDVSIANNLIYAALGIIGTYVFGAAWDDKNFMKAQIDQQATLPEPEPYRGSRRRRNVELEETPPENPQGISEE